MDMYRHYNLPNKDDDPELHDAVNLYQNILIPKLRKYKNIKCRFNFGQFFTNRTIIIIAEPLPGDVADEL